MADAVYGYVQQAIQLEQAIQKIVQKFANAAKTSSELQLFGNDVNSAKLRFLESILRSGRFPEKEIPTLEIALGNLNQKLKKAELYMKDHEPTTFGSRLIWALSAEDEASKMFSDFEESLGSVSDLAKLADRDPFPMILGTDRFSMGDAGRQTLYVSSDFYAAYYTKANYNPRNEASERATPQIDVFIEYTDNDAIENAIDVRHKAEKEMETSKAQEYAQKVKGLKRQQRANPDHVDIGRRLQEAQKLKDEQEKKMERHEARRLREKKKLLENEQTRKERLPVIASRLSWSLQEDNNEHYQTGLLPCLGHFQDSLVFLYPQNTQPQPQTLSDLIRDSNANPQEIIVPFEARFNLALQLAKAVLKIHTIGLVHCAIRSDTILFLKPKVGDHGGEIGRGRTQSRDNNNLDTGKDKGKEKVKGKERRMSWTKATTERATEGVKKLVRSASGTRNKSRTRLNSQERSSARRNDRDGHDQKQSNGKGKSAGKPSSKNSKGENDAEQEQDGDPKDEVGDVCPGFGSVYLTCWSSLQRRGVVPQQEEHDRKRDIYRHPRQGNMQDKSNMGHDIYSLGVCLLEIGIWNSLQSCDIDSAGFRMTLMNIGYTDQGLADLLAQESGRKEVKKSLVKIAGDRLPSLMGTAYTKLVKDCLTCLDAEGKVNWGVDFSLLEKRSEECEAFRTHVVSILQKISMAFVI